MTANNFDINDYLDAVVSNVRTLAEEHPERVYVSEAGCHYRPDEDNPDGCIIGAAARMVDGEGLDFIFEETAASTAVDALCHERGELPASNDLDDLRPEWLDAVQTNQDNDKTWAVAVSLADDELRGMYNSEIIPGL